jgi:hypothetical protein
MSLNLHLVCKDRLSIRRIAGTADTYETGDWVMASATADQCVGGSLFLHDRQRSPSYHGGLVLRWYSVGGDRQSMRVVFVYRHLSGHSNVFAGLDGWSQEMKLVETPSPTKPPLEEKTL